MHERAVPAINAQFARLVASGSAALAAARKSGNALGLLPQAMALAFAMGRKPMPPTRPGVSIIGPLFFHRAARDLVGRLTRQRARFAAIPHAMARFGAPSHDTWVARGEHHEYPARVQRPVRRRQAQADVFGGREGYRKASN